MKLEVLHVPDCPNLSPLLDRLREVTDLPITTRVVHTDAEAAEHGMAGSPTLLIDGTDPFAPGGSCECGVSCRLYRDDDGRILPAPTADQLSAAIAARQTAAESLSEWRSGAAQSEPVERSVHQAILRTFAATGQPPAPTDLSAIATVDGRSVDQVLAALHERDAIRLNPTGEIAAAYPFSAAPSHHRVRIDDPAGPVDVYAMCAVDALGIAAMLDRDTRIESSDAHTGQAITVTTRSGRTTWRPSQAVVFTSGAAGSGPSADCCCDQLNFFTDRATAESWTQSHPDIPGQILDQSEAVQLGAHLFGQLLHTT